MTDRRCEEMVPERPWFILEHECPNPAKFQMRQLELDEIKWVCGVHRRSLLERGWAEVEA